MYLLCIRFTRLLLRVAATTLCSALWCASFEFGFLFVTHVEVVVRLCLCRIVPRVIVPIDFAIRACDTLTTAINLPALLDWLSRIVIIGCLAAFKLHREILIWAVVKPAILSWEFSVLHFDTSSDLNPTVRLFDNRSISELWLLLVKMLIDWFSQHWLLQFDLVYNAAP